MLRAAPAAADVRRASCRRSWWTAARWPFAGAVACALGIGPAAAQPPAPVEPVAALLAQLETAVASSNPAALAPLVAPNADRESIDEFTTRWMTDPWTRVTIHERDRAKPNEGGLRIVAEALVEAGASGRLVTWQLDAISTTGGMLLRRIQTLSLIDGLHRLALDGTRQFQAVDLRVKAEDFELVLARGTVFVAEVPGGTTALVLIGRGEMTFRPAPATERGQVRLFAGDDTLRTAFEAAFVRLPPAELADHLDPHALAGVPVDAELLRGAEEMFDAEVGKSFSVDLGDLSGELWSLLPTATDFLAEVRTRRFGTLTYARGSNQPEDISLFDREHRHNISVYSSKARLAARGPFYNEDDQADYDVLDYDVDVTYVPSRLWFDGRARLRLRVRTFALASLTLRLARTLVVRSVISDQTGRLLFLRVRNQDSLVVNLPSPLARDTEFMLTVSYAGRVEPQTVEQEAAGAGALPQNVQEAPIAQPLPSFIYSNRTYWYPQNGITDYGTATIRFGVPKGFSAVCSGAPAAGSPVEIRSGGGESWMLHVFAAHQPVRYLGCIVSRFSDVGTREVRVNGARPASSDHQPEAYPRYGEVRMTAVANARQSGKARQLLARAADIMSFYAGLVHDVPYPTFSLAVIDSYLPGGHSPPYFATLQSPLPNTQMNWRDDPAAFENYPEFFLAHEIAHQWWGHGIGWQNYHEQWLSEGFAQYFAALYAEHLRGPRVFEGIIRTMSRWAEETSDQGPVYLGYRLGHIRNDGRVFRAVVYNKGAVVLHMLRRLVGDDAFFRAVRRFYDAHRFEKAGTDDLRRAFEQETGRDLSRFFERWIYGSDLPQISWTTTTESSPTGQVVVVRFQQGAEIFDVPITVSLQMRNGSVRDVIVPVTDRVVETRIPVSGTVRSVRVNRDRAALVGGDS